MKLTKFQLFTHIAALLPLAVLVFDVTQGNLSANPIQDITFRTGKAALVLLVLSLAATPLNTLFGWRGGLKVRRALGLYAFGYAAIHLLVYIGLDYGFDWELIWLEIAEKRYVLVGFAAFLILLVLALTSTKGWQRRLRKRWKSLHRWVYLAAPLAVLHYVWVQKKDISQPLWWGAGLAVLLLLRLPAIKRSKAKVKSKK